MFQTQRQAWNGQPLPQAGPDQKSRSHHSLTETGIRDDEIADLGLDLQIPAPSYFDADVDSPALSQAFRARKKALAEAREARWQARSAKASDRERELMLEAQTIRPTSSLEERAQKQAGNQSFGPLTLKATKKLNRRLRKLRKAAARSQDTCVREESRVSAAHTAEPSRTVTTGWSRREKQKQKRIESRKRRVREGLVRPQPQVHQHDIHQPSTQLPAIYSRDSSDEDMNSSSPNGISLAGPAAEVPPLPPSSRVPSALLAMTTLTIRETTWKPRT